MHGMDTKRTNSLLMMFFLALTLIGWLGSAFAGERWAPVDGYSSVNQCKAYSSFHFADIEEVYSEAETYEHETQAYNIEFANYDGYWSSNLPRAY